MRVLHVIPSLCAADGGPSRAIELMEGVLAARGIDVETATTDDDGPGRRTGKPCGVPVHANGAVRRAFRKRFDFYKVAPGFARWVLPNVRGYDVVHVHAMFSFTSVIGAWAARRANVPYVIRPLGVLSEYGVTQRRPLLKRLSLRFVEGGLLRDAAAVHFTSGAERDEALALGLAIRPVVIPLGVAAEPFAGDASRLLPALPGAADAFRIVYLSRLDPKKNLEGLIRALALLRERGHRPALLVGGDGARDHVAALRRLAEAEGVAAQTYWLGHVNGQDKADLLAAGHLFVLPSHSENFGIAVVEALAAGLPCVVGRGVAIAGSVEASLAGVCVETDPPSIAEGIAAYVDAPERLAAARDAARRLAASEYSVERMGERLEQLYASLIAGRARH